MDKNLVLANKWNDWTIPIKSITKSDQPWYALAYQNNLLPYIASNCTFFLE